MNLQLAFDSRVIAERKHFGAIGGMGSHQTADFGKDEWLTPPGIIKQLGPFDLDPCAPVKRPWPTAKRYFTIKENGLLQRWRGRVWLNPPYGSETERWMKKLADHGNGIALVFARTETSTWFNFIWPKADGILFLRGRLNFHHVDGRRSAKNSGAPSALIAYGSANADTLRALKIGHYIEP